MDSTLSPDSSLVHSSTSSSTYTLNANDYIFSYHSLETDYTQTLATGTSSNYDSPPSTGQTSASSYNSTLPLLENTTTVTTFAPTFTNEKVFDHIQPTFTKTDSTYNPSEFKYSTPPDQRKSFYHRVKSLFKTFHIIRHWPKYEQKLERKLLYLREDAAYWRGEVEEEERLQEERLKRQREMMEDKRKWEKNVWGASGEMNGCAKSAKMQMMGDGNLSMVGMC
jgi:hypothetical protein